jgi:hypothetical protein
VRPSARQVSVFPTWRSAAAPQFDGRHPLQIRRDFSKNLIDVLHTGSSNLTLVDTNKEAANSQALSTQQSTAVSALALANQSQASVLQPVALIAKVITNIENGGRNPAAFSDVICPVADTFDNH